MKVINQIFDVRTYLVTVIAVTTFSQFLVHLFGQTIPSVFITYFRNAGEILVVFTVFAFAISWFLKARPHNRPKSYSVVGFDIYGKESKIDGLRTEFTTHDVAWSFMKQYKKSYPLYNFALVSDLPRSSKRTIFRYI